MFPSTPLESFHRCSRRARAAFTLVELLVVIGIIALLIGILLPALNKARESGRQVKCLSNMRQISLAAISWANDHKGYMPARAGGNIVKWDPATAGFSTATGTDTKSPADWISWKRITDPVTGLTISGETDQNITYSALAPYLGTKVIDTTGGPAANQVGRALEEVFRCPSDQLERRDNWDPGSGKCAYRYSYSMNDFYMNPIQPPLDPPKRNGVRYGGSLFTGKLSSIRSPSEKVFVVCEDEGTIDDGVFKANPANWQSLKVNAVASRHQLKYKKASSFANATAGNEDARGNVTFCDGHGEFFSRKDALRAKYSGNPVADPTTGF